MSRRNRRRKLQGPLMLSQSSVLALPEGSFLPAPAFSSKIGNGPVWGATLRLRQALRMPSRVLGSRTESRESHAGTHISNPERMAVPDSLSKPLRRTGFAGLKSWSVRCGACDDDVV